MYDIPPFGSVKVRGALGSVSNFSESLEMMLLPLIHDVTPDTSKFSQDSFRKQEGSPSSQVLPCILTLCREMARDNLKGCTYEPFEMPSSIFKKESEIFFKMILTTRINHADSNDASIELSTENFVSQQSIPLLFMQIMGLRIVESKSRSYLPKSEFKQVCRLSQLTHSLNFK